MPEITAHQPGAFCWAEVGTVDAKRTKVFYSELFGWRFEDRPAGDFGVYSIGQLRGKDICGLYEISADMKKQGVRPHWMSYVAVASADSACEKAKKLGATVLQGPFDVKDVGRMAVIRDPTGAHFSIWGAKKHKGSGILGDPCTPCWFELATKGVEKAEKFYVDLFGWKVKKGEGGGMIYREITNPGSSYPMGGMMELTPQHGPVPPHWMIYYTVNDCDADAKRARSLGGNVLVPPMDIPTVGRFSVLSDPAGASFAIIKLTLEHHGDKQKKG